MKKIIAIATVFALIFAFAACEKKEKEVETQPSRSFMQQEVVVEAVTNEIGEAVTDASGESVTVTQIHEEEITAPSELSSDPAQWTDEEIVAFYKSAAVKSYDKTTSTQVMKLTEMIVNNGDGALGFALKIAEPIIAAALERNSKEFEGITGGFDKLELSDAKSVKAYKSGEYTVIEMTMKEQTDGVRGNMYEGTVGHAISVVGDLSVVQAEFPQFEIDFDNSDFKLHYKNPTLKVKINNDGIIEKGTWSYTVHIDVKHLDISGIMVDTASGKVEYVITVGGGF